MSGAPAAHHRAHAKINLTLAVGPPLAHSTPPGMHPIASWMVGVGMHDDVLIRRLSDHEPSRHVIAWADDAPRPSPIDWPLERDLAVRAHRALERWAGRSLPVDLVLRKRIPVGGGLGGGSSDAATTLMALDALFKLGLDAVTRAEIASTLGSDVAFFLDADATEARVPRPPRPALVLGLGERIERVETPATRVCLLMPTFGCPTGPVYRAFDAATPGPLREHAVREQIRRSNEAGRVDPEGLFNDLAQPAGVVQPDLAAALRTLRAAGITAHVSGSGSTMFVLEPPAGFRERVAQLLPNVAPVESVTLDGRDDDPGCS